MQSTSLPPRRIQALNFSDAALKTLTSGVHGDMTKVDLHDQFIGAPRAPTDKPYRSNAKFSLWCRTYSRGGRYAILIICEQEKIKTKSGKKSLPIHQRFIQLRLFVWKTSIWQTIEGEKSHVIPSLSLSTSTMDHYSKLNYEISNKTRNQKKVYRCVFFSFPPLVLPNAIHHLNS